MFVDEEEVEDLLKALKGQLHGRNFGEGVRLRYRTIVRQSPRLFSGAVSLGRWGHLSSGRAGKCTSIGFLGQPSGSTRFEVCAIFAWCSIVIRRATTFLSIVSKEDFLLHHPYRSFDPVVEMAWRAVEDPNVLAIKMTLYRVGQNHLDRCLGGGGSSQQRCYCCG